MTKGMEDAIRDFPRPGSAAPPERRFAFHDISPRENSPPMSGTENIIYVPEEHRLFLYDFYEWRRIGIGVHSMRARLRPHAVKEILLKARAAHDEYLESVGGEVPPGFQDSALDDFLRSLVDAAQAAESANSSISGIHVSAAAEYLAERAAPAILTLWVRMSDAPVESFFEEDYDPSPDFSGANESPSHKADALCSGGMAGAHKSANFTGKKCAETPSQQGSSNALSASPLIALPTFGSIVFQSLDGAEAALPETGEKSAFLLVMNSTGGIDAEPLDPLQPLPILGEYCGLRGASNQGNAANYTLESQLTSERAGCVPLHRIGERAFATLYFHFCTPIHYDILIRVRGRRLELAERKIAALGYELAESGDRFRIWRRGNPASKCDVLHVYFDLPGRESEDVSVLPPFVIAVQAQGSFNPGLRSRLIRELVRPSQKP